MGGNGATPTPSLLSASLWAEVARALVPASWCSALGPLCHLRTDPGRVPGARRTAPAPYGPGPAPSSAPSRARGCVCPGARLGGSGLESGSQPVAVCVRLRVPCAELSQRGPLSCVPGPSGSVFGPLCILPISSPCRGQSDVSETKRDRGSPSAFPLCLGGRPSPLMWPQAQVLPPPAFSLSPRLSQLPTACPRALV